VLPGAEGYRLVEDQKSAESARTIHLDRHSVAILRQQQRTVDGARAAAGLPWQDHDLVFPRADGCWWNPPAITLAFGRAVKAARVPHICTI